MLYEDHRSLLWGHLPFIAQTRTFNISDSVWLRFDQRLICQRTVISYLLSYTAQQLVQWLMYAYFSNTCLHIWLSAHTHTSPNTHWHIPLKTLAYTHQAWAAKTFSDHPSSTVSPLHPHHYWRCVCVCDRYSLPVRIATKCSDISRLCSPGFVITSVARPSLCPSPSLRLLYLWINASHSILSNQPHST